MGRLGYDRYGAQGGDWGAAVTTQIGRNAGRCAAIHVNMPLVTRPTPPRRGPPPRPSGTRASALRRDSGYAKQQSTRPQTLGYGLADSPVGQCAWIVEKFWSWTDCDGDPINAFGRDELLDNVMLYWFTSAARRRRRGCTGRARHFDPSPSRCRPASSIFPHEIFQAPREWVRVRFTTSRHWHELDRGGHFAAFEQPELFVDEVRAFFATVR